MKVFLNKVKFWKVTCNVVVFTGNSHLLSFGEKTSPQLHEDTYQWFNARQQYLQCIGNGDTADMLLIILALVMGILMKMTGLSLKIATELAVARNMINRGWYIFTYKVSLIPHYNDVIMGMISSQITSLTIVFSTVYSDTDQRKHQSSASLALVRGFHRGPVNSPHEWPVTQKMFPFDEVIKKKYGLSSSNCNIIENYPLKMADTRPGPKVVLGTAVHLFVSST